MKLEGNIETTYPSWNLAEKMLDHPMAFRNNSVCKVLRWDSRGANEDPWGITRGKTTKVR